MGQESPIEPWLATDNRAACESPNPPASLRQNDENRWQRKPKALPESSSVPRSRNGRPEQSSSTGWAGRQENLRPQEKCFFLDSFYRTNQDLRRIDDCRLILESYFCAPARIGRAKERLPGSGSPLTR